MYLLAHPSVERWLRKKASGTRYEYLTRHTRLAEKIRGLTGAMTPDDFVSWAKARDGTEVQDVIEQVAEGQRQGSQNGAVACLRSLLRKNGYNSLPKMDSVPGQLEYHPGYKRKEVQELLEYLDRPIQKLYVLFAKDSGLRAQDIPSLAYRHVKKDLEAGNEFVHLELEPAYYQRKKSAGITFIGPNTVRLLRKLINSGTIKSEPEARMFPFKYTSLHEALILAKSKAGLDRKIQPSHGLRKFFENSLDRVGMDHHKKLQLEGHSQGVRIHYTDRTIDELRELYRQAYVHLDLSEAAVKEKAMLDLESKITQLTRENKELREKLERVGDLPARLEKIERQLRKEAETE